MSCFISKGEEIEKVVDSWKFDFILIDLILELCYRQQGKLNVSKTELELERFKRRTEKEDIKAFVGHIFIDEQQFISI